MLLSIKVKRSWNITFKFLENIKIKQLKNEIFLPGQTKSDVSEGVLISFHNKLLVVYQGIKTIINKKFYYVNFLDPVRVYLQLLLLNYYYSRETQKKKIYLLHFQNAGFCF